MVSVVVRVRNTFTVGRAVAIVGSLASAEDDTAVLDGDGDGTAEVAGLEALGAPSAVVPVDDMVDRIDGHFPVGRDVGEGLGALSKRARAEPDAIRSLLDNLAVAGVDGVEVRTAALSTGGNNDPASTGGDGRAIRTRRGREGAGRDGASGGTAGTGAGRAVGVATAGTGHLGDVNGRAAASGSRAIVVVADHEADDDGTHEESRRNGERPKEKAAVVVERNREGTGVVTAVAIIVATATVTTAALRVVGGPLGRIVALALKVVDLRLDVHSLPAGGRVVAIGVGLNPGGQLPVDALARTFSGDFLVVVVVDDVGGREGLDRSGLWSGRVEGLEGFVVPHVLAHALRRVDRPLGAVRRLFGGGERVGVVREGVAEFDEPGVNGRDGLVRRADVFRALLVFADDTVDSGVEVSEGGAGIRLVGRVVTHVVVLIGDLGRIHGGFHLVRIRIFRDLLARDGFLHLGGRYRNFRDGHDRRVQSGKPLEFCLVVDVLLDESLELRDGRSLRVLEAASAALVLKGQPTILLHCPLMIVEVFLRDDRWRDHDGFRLIGVRLSRGGRDQHIRWGCPLVFCLINVRLLGLVCQGVNLV